MVIKYVMRQSLSLTMLFNVTYVTYRSMLSVAKSACKHTNFCNIVTHKYKSIYEKCIFHMNISSLPFNFDELYALLRQFLPTESPFKMMKNAFYFTLKAIFVLKIF